MDFIFPFEFIVYDEFDGGGFWDVGVDYELKANKSVIYIWRIVYI